MYVYIYIYIYIVNRFRRGWFQQTGYCRLCLCRNSAVCHVALSEIEYFETTPMKQPPTQVPNWIDST